MRKRYIYEDTFDTSEDDPYKPIKMQEPKVLYRSISLPELFDIYQTGKIVGKKSSFHGGGEHRPWVFFGDELSPDIIWQGSDVGRQASVALDTHPIHDKFKELKDALSEHLKVLVDALRNELVRVDRSYVRAGYKSIDMNAKEELLQRVLRGNSDVIPQVTQGIPRDNLQPLLNKIYKIEKQKRATEDKYQELYKKTSSGIIAKLAPKPYSSAVVRTRPLSGGLHYSKNHGKTAMTGDEYCFRPGQVTLDDIDYIYLVKNEQRSNSIVAEGDPAQVLKLLKTAKMLPKQPPKG